MFFAHGAQKMLGWFGGYGFHGTMGFFEHMGMPAPVAFLIICTEFFGGLGLIVGLLTRIAALGIGVEMIGAIFMVHLPNGFFMNWVRDSERRGIRVSLAGDCGCGDVAIARGGSVVGGQSVERITGAPAISRIDKHRGSVAQRLTGFQRVLNSLLRLLFAAEGFEGFALQIENVLFADGRAGGDVTPAEDFGDLCAQLLLVIADEAALAHEVDAES